MDKKPAPAKAEKPAPRRLSTRYLENAALHYLQRYASSSENLRRVLQRKIDRASAFHNTDPAPFAAFVDSLLERYAKSGLLNDKTYAEGRVATLRRQGRSRQDIQARLGAKGLSRDLIDAALAVTDDAGAGPEAELAAARRLAQKKKLGVYNIRPATDPERRRKEKQRDMAALARAGFSYDIARQALGATADADGEAAVD